MAEEQKPTEEIVEEVIQKSEIKEFEVQRLIVKFADGKVGIFSGPAIFTKTEMQLVPPRIVDVTITNPEPMKVKVPVLPKVEEKPNDTKNS